MAPDGEAPEQVAGATQTGAPAVPADWYPNPNGEGQRYWDGGGWTDQVRSAPSAPAPSPEQPPAPLPVPAAGATPAAPMGFAPDLYSEGVDLNQVLTPEQRELYKQHTLTSFPTGAAVALNIVLFPLTFGIFTMIFNLLRHDRFPKVKPDDPSAGKAIGLMFIPFYNLYWQFVAWPRLAQRINFQFRLRGRPSPISEGLVRTTLILNLVTGFILVTFPIVWVLAIILVAQSQSAINELAAERGM